MTKTCSYRGCRNDSRYLDPTVVKGATFYPFPKKKTNLEKCKRWLRAIGKDNLTNVDQVKQHHYVCNYHFVGGMGPTDRNPDPIPYEPRVNVIETKPESFSATSVPSTDIMDTYNQKIDPIVIVKTEEDKETPKNNNLNESSLILNDIITETENEGMVSDLQIEKLKSLDEMLFKFWEYQVKNPRDQLMWCAVKDYDSDTLIFKKSTSSGNILSISVKIHNSFEVKVEVLGHLISETSKLYHSEKYLKFINNLEELLSFLIFIDSCSFCGGIMEKELSELPNVKNSFSNRHTNSLHSLECELLYNDQGKSIRCKKCSQLRRILARRLKKRKLATNFRRNIKRNDINDEQKKDLLKKKSAEIKKLKRQIEGLNKKIEMLLNKVKEKLGKKDQTIFNDIIEDNPFVTKENFRLIMLKQQMDIVSRNIKRPRKWNDSIIKWSLYLRSKSPAAYKALREVFTLPAPRTLFPYAAAFSGKSGFSIEVIKEMRAKIDLKNVEEHQKYFSVIVDEMKIKQDLVYKASTGELVGFCHLNEAGDKEEENKKLTKDTINPPLATHVMTVAVRGITTNFKHVLGYFPCHNMTEVELYSIIEESIEILENNHFKVLTVICDKSSINQKVIKMSTDPENGVYYKCQNSYAPVDDPRPIFFILDSPHLIKTVRNCFANSGKEKPRLLKKNGKHILWSHVQDMYNKDCQSQIRLCPKLTHNHISLGPFYAMRVKLATQIMSKSVATAIKELVGDEAAETVKFITIFNQFFDVLNTKNVGEGKKKNKNLEPFSSLTDWRFKWLKEEFLEYLKEWKDEVDACTDLTPEEKNMMLLSRETLEGLHTTVHSVIGAVNFLINKGAKFVLTNKLNQDP